MDVQVYDLTVPQFIRSLEALKGVLRKAQAFAETKKIDPSVLLQSRLIADQFPLGKQIQITCDGAKFCYSRLSGKEAPKYEDNETTLDQYMQRIDKTVAFLRTAKAEDFAKYRDTKASFHWNPGKWMDGHTYLVQHAVPNFYFHLTTAYSILRANGVDLGKADFLGAQDWKND